MDVDRGAKIYAEITGYGVTCDAYHRVRLEENGIEPARAMSLAMEDAGISPSEVDHVNLHGTSTQLNDRIETQAVKHAFGEFASRTRYRCQPPNRRSAIHREQPGRRASARR